MPTTPTNTIRRAKAVINTLRIELRKLDSAFGPGSNAAWNKLQEIEEISSALKNKEFSILEGLLDLRSEFPNH